MTTKQILPAGSHHNVHHKPGQPTVPIHVGMDETKKPMPENSAHNRFLLAPQQVKKGRHRVVDRFGRR